MRLTEPTTPPADYMPERAPHKPWKPQNLLRFCQQGDVGWDLADTIYATYPHDTWALRAWAGGNHNHHVQWWHGESLPERCR